VTRGATCGGPVAAEVDRKVAAAEGLLGSACAGWLRGRREGGRWRGLDLFGSKGERGDGSGVALCP
jgi:hypothetical protein